MAFDQTTRNSLARFVSDTRSLLTEEFTRQLQNDYGLDPTTGDVTDLDRLTHLDDARRETARLLRDTMEHYLASVDTSTPAKAKKARQDVLDRIVREQAFTVLNRLCALRMAEARGLLIDSVAKGYQSKGFQLYQRLAGTALGETGDAYRLFLFSVFDEFAVDLAVLFDRFSPQGRLFPRDTALLAVLEQLHHANIDPLWTEDETIGWIYQYFNQKIERDAMRKASRSPRNAREMAVRNQFFTPRYVVEFLTDNTLGRIWYEMAKGATALKDSCRYLVRLPNEVFLVEGEEAPEQDEPTGYLSQEELLKKPFRIPHRPLKDPRDIKMLDPACGSMHFGLYAFDLFEIIYNEAWVLETELGADSFAQPEGLNSLHETYDSKEAFLRDVPRLIMERNIHGIDIDPRAVQIAGFSLWLRAQRYWQTMNVKAKDRPQIQRSNIVCAEPMPGEADMLDEFVAQLQPKVLGQLVRIIFDKMKLAGEAGSLLKIEDDIRDAISVAHQEYQEFIKHQKMDMGFLPGMAPERDASLFDFADLAKEDTFWESAETLVLRSLKDYAEQAEAETATRRRMFARDAAQGFAFVDLCRSYYDVILMNPPFGAASRNSKHYIDARYPKTKGDVLANFVERTLELSHVDGRIGAISSRTPFYLGSFESLRTEILGKLGHVRLLADLGEGVLEAMVETATYVLSPNRSGYSYSMFFRLLIDEWKGTILHELAQKCSAGYTSSRAFLINPTHFAHLSGNPYAYWASKTTIESLSHFPRIEGSKATIRVGLQTGDDFRFLRCLWELDPTRISPSPAQPHLYLSAREQCLDELVSNKHWAPFSKTGKASPWFSPLTLAVNWSSNGHELRHFTNATGKLRSALRSEQEYFKPGFSYMLRSTRLVPYLVPSGVIPTAGRAQIFPKEGEEYAVLGICASNVGSAVARFSGEMFARPKFQASMVQGLPACEFSQETLETIKKHVDAEVNKRREVVQRYEPYQEFLLPAWIHSGEGGKTAWDLHSLFGKGVESKIAKAFSISSEQLVELERDIREAVSIRGRSGDDEPDDSYVYSNKDDQELNVELIAETPKTKAIGLFMYLVGVAFGRWDVRITIDPSIAPKLPAPFDPLAVCPPGMLVGPEGLPAKSGCIVSEEWLRARPDANTLPKEGAIGEATIRDCNYPVQILWNGILVDDPANEWDIVNRSRSVLELICGDQDEIVETKISSIVGASSFQDYVRKPSGFFNDHFDAYSKNRRYAPIYWPLSTPSGSYTLWLYYHRLTNQTLYSCVNDFVEPKLKQTADVTAKLRKKMVRSSREEIDLELFSNLELELRDFREELLRIAQFWKPDLNDGVQITAAPLWRLFQHRQWQSKLKNTWEKLNSGEYDWAHLALSIWPDRVVRASHQDHSYAIAHDLEDQLWHQVEVTTKTKWGNIKKSIEWQPRDLTEPDLVAIIAEVQNR